MGLFKSVKTLFATLKWFSEVRKRTLIILYCLFVGLSVGAGCSQKAAQPPTTATANWSWDTYPKVEKMRLAILPCRIFPKTSLTINAPVSGQLRLYIDRPQTNLPTDFVWAEF